MIETRPVWHLRYWVWPWGWGVRATAEGRRTQEEGDRARRDSTRPGCGQRAAPGWAGYHVHDGGSHETQEDRNNRSAVGTLSSV